MHVPRTASASLDASGPGRDQDVYLREQRARRAPSATRMANARAVAAPDSDPGATYGTCADQMDHCALCENDIDCSPTTTARATRRTTAARATASSPTWRAGGEACQSHGNCASGLCVTWQGSQHKGYCATIGTNLEPCGGGSQGTHCYGYTGSEGGTGCRDGPCLPMSPSSNGQCLAKRAVQQDARIRTAASRAPAPRATAARSSPGQSNRCMFTGGLAPGGSACQGNHQCASGHCFDWWGAFQRRFCRPGATAGEPCNYNVGNGLGLHAHCWGGADANSCGNGRSCVETRTGSLVWHTHVQAVPGQR